MQIYQKNFYVVFSKRPSDSYYEPSITVLFQLEFGSRAKDKVVSELTEEEKNVKALKRWKI